MKVKKAWLVSENSSVPFERLARVEGLELSLSALYPIIGCSTAERVALKRGVEMWVDEEGLLKGRFIVNERATKFYRDAFPHINPSEIGIVGNAVIIDNTKAGDFINFKSDK